jgi:Ca-activated chloride channel family protein
MFRWLAEHKTAALALAAAVLGVGAVLAQQQPAPLFRTNVSLVHVIASVKNSKGELVGALKQSDFRVFDNGVEQKIAVFEPESSQALSVALMIDASGSTAKDLKYETDSAAKFLRALLTGGSNPQDAVALYSFDADVTEERSFTHNYSSLETALKYIKGSGGTSLYDAIYQGAHQLEPRRGRKVIVVISDGGNTTSTIDIQKALKAAQLADAVIYAVVVVPITNDAGRNLNGEHALYYMAMGTGGRQFYPSLGKELDKAFADIIAELRTQYFLGYYPSGVPLPKDPYHKLEVRVGSPDLVVSARNGYYGDAEGAGGSATAPVAVIPSGQKKK